MTITGKLPSVITKKSTFSPELDMSIISTVYRFKTMEEIEAMSPEEYSVFLAWGDPQEDDEDDV